MIAVAGAAVPVFCSLDSPARVSANVGLRLSLHSSPPPTSSKSSNPSDCRYKSRRRRGIAEAVASSFSSDSDDEEVVLGYGNAGAEGSQFTGRRNATRRFAGEESASGARVSSAFHSWVPQKNYTRGAQITPAFKKHDPDKSMAYNRGNDMIPYEQRQHHTAFVGKKLPRVPLRTKNQHLRTHNKVSAFGSVRQPVISGRSPNNHTDASSWGVEDEDIALSFDREALNLYEDSQYGTNHGNKLDAQKGTKFMSKLEEVLSSLKKKDDLLRNNLAMNQKVLRDESMLTRAEQGLQTATCESKKAEESRASKFAENSEGGNAKSIDCHIERSARNANKTSARDDLRGFSLMNNGKRLQREPGEAKLSLKENASMDNEAGVATFNLFSSSPAVPWQADREYESAFKPGLPIRSGNMQSLARRSFRSIGSRSSPSQPSASSRNVYLSKLQLHAATRFMDPSKLIGRAEQVESQFDIREGIVLKEDKPKSKVTSLKGAPKADGQVESVIFDRTESNAEENNDNALSIHQSTEENTTKAHAPTESSLSALSSHGDSEANEDNDVLIESDVEDAVPSEIDSFKRSYHNNKSSVGSGDSDVEDAEPLAFDSSERCLHNTKETLPSSVAHTNAASAEFPDKMTSGASEMSNGSKHPHSASWHKHDFSDLPFDFQFSYSETPKVPVLGYREIPYSPFGPSTMGRPWTGTAPPNPSKKKKWVFDSFKPPPKNKKGVKYVEDPGPYPEGQGPKQAKSREEILGEPLTKEEIIYLVEKSERESRQLNLGRDGLTHNMLDLIHCHWKRRRVCKIKCKGVPTLDMDNVKFHIEDKTQGKIIYQAGGVLYLFRGRNYNYKDRPQIPLMIWKPATPRYPKLIQPAPEGLTKEEAQRLRSVGRKVQPICRLGKNGVYLNLVNDVRTAFKVDELVRIDCQGLNPSDYKKIGGKLKDLVPCVLLSFDKERILLWRGKQNLSIENSSLSGPPTLEPHHTSEKILKQSPSLTDEENDCSVSKENLDISADEASNSTHASEGDAWQEMQQSSSEQDLGSMLDKASQEYSMPSSDARAHAVLEEPVHSPQADIDQTWFSSSNKDEDHALADTVDTEYASNSKLPKEENSEVSLAKSSLMGDENGLHTVDFLPKEHATTDRKLQQKTESEGPDTAIEEMSNSVVLKLEGDDHKELLQLAAEYEEEDGLMSDEEEDQHLGSDVVHLDELWDHAFSSGMAVELPDEGMDEDLIIREAAQLAKSAPLGPTYTIKLRHKLQIKKYVQRPDDYLYVPFGRGRPRRIPKKAVKRKPRLPTLDVPGMGGLPVDELAMLLAPKQDS